MQIPSEIFTIIATFLTNADIFSLHMMFKLCNLKLFIDQKQCLTCVLWHYGLRSENLNIIHYIHSLLVFDDLHMIKQLNFIPHFFVYSHELPLIIKYHNKFYDSLSNSSIMNNLQILGLRILGNVNINLQNYPKLLKLHLDFHWNSYLTI